MTGTFVPAFNLFTDFPRKLLSSFLLIMHTKMEEIIWIWEKFNKVSSAFVTATGLELHNKLVGKPMLDHLCKLALVLSKAFFDIHVTLELIFTQERYVKWEKHFAVLYYKDIQKAFDDFNPLNVNFIKWSNTLKQFVGSSQRIVWMCLTILWDWHLKG